MTFDHRSQSLIRLALCPGAAEGEWRNAAIALFQSLRRGGISPESLLNPSRHQPPPRMWSKMPFGKHRGRSLDHIPGDYLRWVLHNCSNLSPHLRGEIQELLRQGV